MKFRFIQALIILGFISSPVIAGSLTYHLITGNAPGNPVFYKFFDQNDELPVAVVRERQQHLQRLLEQKRSYIEPFGLNMPDNPSISVTELVRHRPSQAMDTFNDEWIFLFPPTQGDGDSVSGRRRIVF